MTNLQLVKGKNVQEPRLESEGLGTVEKEYLSHSVSCEWKQQIIQSKLVKSSSV